MKDFFFFFSLNDWSALRVVLLKLKASAMYLRVDQTSESTLHACGDLNPSWDAL
jgi:hypothetical protein